MNSLLVPDIERRFGAQDARYVSRRLGQDGLYELKDKSFRDVLTQPTVWYMERSIERSVSRFPDGVGGLWLRISKTWKLMCSTLSVDVSEKALDIIASHGVPLQKTAAWSSPSEAYTGVLFKDEYSVAGHARGSMEHDNVSMAFASAWGNHLCMKVGLSNRAFLKMSTAKNIEVEFLNFARSWAKSFGRDVGPSKQCIAFCRAHFDGRWKNRKFGESVTTLYLERFQLELAWASRYRYVCELDHKFQKSYADHMATTGPQWLEKKPLRASEGAAGYVLPDVFPGPEVMNGFQATLKGFGLWDYKDCVGYDGRWSPSRAAQAEKAYGSKLRASSPWQVSTLWRSMPGVMGHMFLEYAYRNTDYVFMFMLQAFIESESSRASYPLFERSHKAYKRSVVDIKAHRTGTPDYYSEYRKFGWFHAASYMVIPTQERKDFLKDRELWLPFIPTGSRKQRARRFLGLQTRKNFEHYRRTDGEMQARTQEMAARMAIVIETNWSDLMVDATYVNAALFNPVARASRFTYANKARPLVQRYRYAKIMKKSTIATLCMTTSEWRDTLGGMLSPSTMQKLIRATRNEFLCGYAGYGPMSASNEDVAYIAYRALYKKMRYESAFSYSLDYHLYERGCSFAPTNRNNLDLRAHLTRYLMRSPWGEGEGMRLKENALKMSYRAMMANCKPIIHDNSQFFAKAGIKDPAIFALWKENIKARDFVDCSNFTLSYLNFVSLVTLWSKDVYLTCVRPAALSNRSGRTFKVLPSLFDRELAEVVIVSDDTKREKNVFNRIPGQTTCQLKLDWDYGNDHVIVPRMMDDGAVEVIQERSPDFFIKRRQPGLDSRPSP